MGWGLDTTPEVLSATVTARAGVAPGGSAAVLRYRPVPADGARRAATLLAELL